MKRFSSIIVGVIVASTGISMYAGADEVRTEAERLLECRELADAEAKLACYEATANALDDALEALESDEVANAKADEIDRQEALAAEASAVAEAEARAAQAEERARLAEARAAEVEAQQAAAEAQQSEVAQEARLPMWARVFPRDSADRPKDPKVLPITVTKIQRNSMGRHFFETSDGQLWRQNSPEEIRPPKSLPAAANVSRTLAGAKWLKFETGGGRATQVRRVE